MSPDRCNRLQCPRHLVHKGNDVCVLYQVSEKDEELAVLDVFNVGHKHCRQLRQHLAAAIMEDAKRFGQPKEIAITPLNKEGK